MAQGAQFRGTFQLGGCFNRQFGAGKRLVRHTCIRWVYEAQRLVTRSSMGARGAVLPRDRPTWAARVGPPSVRIGLRDNAEQSDVAAVRVE